MQPQAVSGVSCEDLNHCGSLTSMTETTRHAGEDQDTAHSRDSAVKVAAVADPAPRCSNLSDYREHSSNDKCMAHMLSSGIFFCTPAALRASAPHAKTIHPKFANKHADYNSTEESIMITKDKSITRPGTTSETTQTRHKSLFPRAAWIMLAYAS